MTYEKDVSTEMWNDPTRNKVRSELVSQVATVIKKSKLPKKLRYLGLCAHHWKFEKELADAVPNKQFIMFGTEQNEIVHKNALKHARILTKNTDNATFNIWPEATDLRTAFRVFSPLSFDLAFFDYMALWNSSKEEELEYFIKNNISDKFLLLFTTGILRTSKLTQEKLANYAKMEITTTNLRELYSLGVTSFIKTVAKKSKKICQPVIHLPYRNKSGLPQMIFGFNIESK